MSKRNRKISFVRGLFEEFAKEQGLTDFDFDIETRAYTNQQVQMAFIYFNEGHVKTKNRLFGTFIIGKKNPDKRNRIVFSEEPFVHETYRQARTEAEALMVKYPGNVFVVYQSVQSFNPKVHNNLPSVEVETHQSNPL